MQPASAPASSVTDAPFRYVGGDPSADFVNTVNWTERGLERDRLFDYGRLLEWARGAGVLGAREERQLRRAAQAQPRRAAEALEAARHLRDVLQRVLSAAARGQLTLGGLDELNALLAEAASHVRIVRAEGGGLARGWEGLGESLESPLWPVTWAAAELLASSEAARLRVCAGDDCGWVYVDRSRNGLRRWCEMSTCGTTEKNRRRAPRRP
ncbi:MAG TPA: ABATE domain-containing protein [Gemmatimonadaceae bacterium]|nr:ABATE domain-containing protein [Gemmatimonadaceae bacterium]